LSATFLGGKGAVEVQLAADLRGQVALNVPVMQEGGGSNMGKGVGSG
jgi:hypothetical protein